MKHFDHYFILLALASCAVLCGSCIKSEALNNECDIISAWVEGDDLAEHFYQQSQMRNDNVPTNTSTIVFTVKSLLSLPPLAVHFDITPGATITPENGSIHDFSAGPVTYTVTSADGDWTRQYQVVFREADLPSFQFHFENVDEVNYGTSTYHVFFEEDQVGTRHDIWASGNQGVAIVQTDWTPTQFPTYQTENGYEGKGVCLNTQYAGDLGKMMGKPIAAGNLFMGTFDLISVLINPLKATQFGIPMNREPIRVTGYYKYQPGPTFTNAQMEEVPGRTDEANIYAVFYRNEDADGNKIILYGDDVLTSPYLVRKAQVKSLPPTNTWTRFEMFFEGDNADPQILAARGYSFALVFSSSKNGDVFEGAIGSTLYVDEVEVSFEKEEEE